MQVSWHVRDVYTTTRNASIAVLIKFGHDGWHGQLARDVTFETVEAIARVAAVVMTRDAPESARIVVGHGRRFLSSEFANAIAMQLASLGIEAWLIPRPVPTPVLSFAVRKVGASGGIMVTASHLPPDQNGLKLRASDGGALSSQALNEIESLVAEGTPARPVGPTASIVEMDPIDDYLAAVSRQVHVKAIQRAGLTVAIDSMWGAAAELLPRLIDGDGSRSVEIRAAHNPRFPDITAPDPVASNLERLQRVIMTGSAAFGIAINGDGSTISLIDEHGHFIDQTVVSSLVAYYLLSVKRMRGSVARSIASPTGIERLSGVFGVQAHELDVGFSSISESIREYEPLIVEDHSGGIILPKHLPDRDAILAAMLVTACVVETGQSVSELIEEIDSMVGRRAFKRLSLPLTGNQMNLVQERMNRDEWPARVAERDVVETYWTDGMKLEFADDVWLLVRIDEHECALDLVAEADDVDTVNDLLKAGRHLMLV